MISLPSGFATQVASSSTDTIAGLAPFIALISGVLLSAVVITMLIHALSGRH